jgi:RNA processing factor Prp31
MAAKASIAAKIDAFEGTPWTQDDVDLMDNRVEEIKAAHPKPPRRNR